MALGFLGGLDSIKPAETMPVVEYFTEWANSDELHLNAAGKLRKAIGDGEEIDYQKEPRFARIFPGRPMRRYKPFKDLLGCEEPIHRFVKFLEHARDGLQAERQLVSFVGPVSAGKSKVLTICQDLFKTQPGWILGFRANDGTIEPSPLFESPLGLFNEEEHGEMCEKTYRIPRARLVSPMSGWATSRFEKCGGDLSRFVAVKVMPSKAKGILLATVDPDMIGIHNFIGYAERRGDIETYHHTGAFNRTTIGLLEFAEMWNADWTTLQKFLFVTEDRRYVGDGASGIMPYQGLIIAHGNEQPWIDFKNGKFARSGAHFTGGLVDRTVTIEFPHCIRITELQELYRQYLDESGFKGLHLGPGALEVAAAFAAATRLKDPSKCSVRLDIHDGRYTGLKADTAEDLRMKAHYRDGMGGISERKMFDILPELAEADPNERGLDPVLVLEELEKIVIRARLPNYGEPDDGKESSKREPLSILKEVGFERCNQIVIRTIQEAYFESWSAYAATRFDEYVDIAAAWCEQNDYKQANDVIIRFSELDGKLSKLEGGGAMIEAFARSMLGDSDRRDRPNADNWVKDARSRMSYAALKHRATHPGTPVWEKLSEHLRIAFEHSIRPGKKDMLELIDLDRERKNPDEIKEHKKFLERMCARGYTMGQVRRMLKWFVKHGK